MKKKIILFGPFADFGGRELECSFIASLLSTKHHVDICTTNSVSNKSQLFDFNNKQNVFSIKELLCRKYLIIYLLSFFSYLKNNFKGTITNYANNKIAKRNFNYYKKVNNILEELVVEYDLIFICAQLSSTLNNEIINIAKANNKLVLFRTTGAIIDIEFKFIDKVDCFIHHSLNNAKKIENYKKHNFVIIDQCAFNENRLLEIPYIYNRTKIFLTVSRLVKEKNIDVVIKAFLEAKKIGDKLFVVGEGTEYDNLVKSAEGDDDVIFTGFVSNKNLHKYFSLSDCVILSYFELETGPLTGIEAMAASRAIISAKTGAMQERINFNEFWFNNTKEDLIEQINSVKELDATQILEISKKNRDRYLQEYSIEKIEQKYLNIVDKVFMK